MVDFFEPIFHALDLLNKGVVIINREGKIVTFNNAANRYSTFSLQRGEYFGKFFPWLPTDFPEKSKTIVNLNNMKPKIIRIIRNVFYYQGESYNILVLENRSGAFRLTKQVKILRDKVELYESILNSLDEGVIISDSEGRITYINQAQQSLDKIDSPQKLIGDHVSKAYNVNEHTSLILRAIKNKEPVPDEHQYYINKFGQAVNIVAKAFPLFSKKGKLLGSVCICRDTSKLQQFVDRISQMLNSKKSQLPKSKSTSTLYTFEDIVGQKSKSFKNALHWAKCAANTDSNVLIYGPTGTGKELFAQSIHNASSRRNYPFLAINCAALPETLLESILFGTVKGAFTGAVDRPGLFEQANGGTLFLDELNSMPLGLQAKLLRVIENGIVRRVGGTQDFHVSVRIISSLNVDPFLAIETGKLREDLFYRLAVILIELPPLAQRKEDLSDLVHHFIAKFNAKFGRNIIGVSPQVMDLMMSYDWPGNVRELMHVIECAMNKVKPQEKYIDLEHLPHHFQFMVTREGPIKKKNDIFSPQESKIRKKKNMLKQELELAEKNLILQTLNKTGWNISKTAKILGVSRQSLQYRLKKFNIQTHPQIFDETIP